MNDHDAEAIRRTIEGYWSALVHARPEIVERLELELELELRAMCEYSPDLAAAMRESTITRMRNLVAYFDAEKSATAAMDAIEKVQREML